MAAELPQQLWLGVEHVRHAARVHRDAVDELLIEPKQSHRERGGAEIREPEVGSDDSGERCVSGEGRMPTTYINFHALITPALMRHDTPFLDNPDRPKPAENPAVRRA